MIRKIFMLLVVISLFFYVAWTFYTDALLYNPLPESAVKQVKVKEAEIIKSKYSSAWSEDIHEKNLLAPNRTYKPPKPVVIAPPVEPPKRPNLVLKGIVLDTFGDYVAYIEINQAKAAALRKADKVEDIEVMDITEKKVVLQWNNEMIDLSIEKIKTLSKPRTGK